jgi:1-acyl-sn-glycerol-3-phosphate acyltransferase
MDGVETKHLQGISEGRWLPIPGVMDTRARRAAARTIAATLRWCMKARFHVQIGGLEHFSCSPATLVVANHRRDTDGPIIGAALLRRIDQLEAGTPPCFVAREDLFRTGFLRDYLTGWPAPLRELLAGIDLRPFLDAINLYPMRRIRERTLGEVLEDTLAICGDLPLDQVLRPSWEARFRELSVEGEAGLMVSDVLARRYRPLLRQPFGLMKLTRERFRALRPHEDRTIRSQLLRFVELLEHGAMVQLEPEGTTSDDGSLGRLRGGLHFLLNQTRSPVRVLPIGITYDFMTSGRQWVFVQVGRELPNLQGLSRRQTTARVTEAMLACSTLTASQLASRWLLEVQAGGGGCITAAQLNAQVSGEARRLSLRGAHVDPRLLESGARKKRLAQYLEYCRRSATLLPSGRGRYLVRGGVEPPAQRRRQAVRWNNPDSAFGYVHNELMSVTPLWPEVAGGGEP